jgi:formiminoglutamase
LVFGLLCLVRKQPFYAKAYKFTLDENTPFEEDIALDPEMLGLVFENLLAELDPNLEESAIKSIANIQHNRFCKGSQIVVWGALDVAEEMELVQNLDFNVTADRKKLSELVVKIDKEVAHIISLIVTAGKIPLVIGGGHNNAYGNIKGTALAKGKPINAVNFDAHSDFRILEGRHSGNGFSYAFEEGFLKKYFIFGLHENYTSKNVLDILKKMEDRVTYNTYDEIKVRQQKNFQQELNTALDFIKNDAFGIEIDLDFIFLLTLFS